MRLRLRTIALYLALFFAVWMVPDLMLRYEVNELSPSMEHISPYRDKPGLFAKVAYYREHAREFDLLFVGDSRTYCGMAPDVLDPMLGSHSINLSSFANWFPTQFPSLQDILAEAPPGTIVVWSIGHQNFQKVFDTVKLMYPIGLRNVPRYLDWGYPWSSISDNVLDEIPGLKIFVWRHTLRDRLNGILARTLPIRQSRASTPPPSPSADAGLAARIAAYRSDPSVVYVEPLYDQGEITSLALYKRGGNYVRVELRPEFFRQKQREMAADTKPLAGPRFVPDPEYWNNFLGIVDLIASHKVRLIVNEFEEAPYQYEVPENRRLYRSFMGEIRSFFESRGIPYVRVDFDQLTDADYFDYNHLNEGGIQRFSRMFAEQVQPVLRELEAAGGVQ
jgi:hypothetical protein